jgi:ATP-binding protein involved in chromosome partitioning
MEAISLFGKIKSAFLYKPNFGTSSMWTKKGMKTVEGQSKQVLSKLSLPGVKNIIAVASGKGGVGKSTTAVNLAISLASFNRKIGLLDADIYGPSIPMLMNLREKPQVDEKKKLIPLVNYGIKCMSMGFMIDKESPMIWRGPMVMSALEQMLRDTQWGELDTMVIDLPPGTGDAQLSICQRVPLNGAVIVCTPQDLALLDAVRGTNMFRKLQVPILGIVENMSYFTCSSCSQRHYIFGKEGAKKKAEEMGIHFLGEIPLIPKIRELSDTGRPITITEGEGPHAAAYKNIAKDILTQLESESFIRAQQPPKIVVQ